MAFPTAEMVFVTVTSCGQASHEISREMEVVFDVFALRSHWCFLVVDTFVTITMHDRLTLTLAIEIYFEIPGFLKASFAPTPTNVQAWKERTDGGKGWKVKHLGADTKRVLLKWIPKRTDEIQVCGKKWFWIGKLPFFEGLKLLDTEG